jgi:hypothetical protein
MQIKNKSFSDFKKICTIEWKTNIRKKTTTIKSSFDNKIIVWKNGLEGKMMEQYTEMKTRKVFFIISFIFDWDLHCWDTLPY